MKNIFWSLMQ